MQLCAPFWDRGQGTGEGKPNGVQFPAESGRIWTGKGGGDNKVLGGEGPSQGTFTDLMGMGLRLERRYAVRHTLSNNSDKCLFELKQIRPDSRVTADAKDGRVAAGPEVDGAVQLSEPLADGL